MNRMQIQVTEDQQRRLRQLAADRGVSIATVVRQAVDAELEIGDDPSVSRRRALAAMGGFHSGRGDVAGDHDRYLADDFR